jgi:hypothetical protein
LWIHLSFKIIVIDKFQEFLRCVNQIMQFFLRLVEIFNCSEIFPFSVSFIFRQLLHPLVGNFGTRFRQFTKKYFIQRTKRSQSLSMKDKDLRRRLLSFFSSLKRVMERRAEGQRNFNRRPKIWQLHQFSAAGAASFEWWPLLFD